MDNMFSVEGKNVIVTGGTGGIGSALVNGFRLAGANVASFDKTRPAVLPTTYKFYMVDLSSKKQCEEAFISYLEYFNHADVLINCAGRTLPSNDRRYPDILWSQTLKNNLEGVWNLTMLVGMNMIKQYICGSIINITSINFSSFGNLLKDIITRRSYKNHICNENK